jgi:hypothetical protein
MPHDNPVRIVEWRGRVSQGFGIASGRDGHALGLQEGTLACQAPVFLVRGWDLAREIPGYRHGTINVRLDRPLRLARPDITLSDVDWAPPHLRTHFPPESFSFTRCSLFHASCFVAGIIYYPHPETKPSVNSHDHCILEVIAPDIEDLRYDDPISVICRSDAFVEASKAD